MFQALADGVLIFFETDRYSSSQRIARIARIAFNVSSCFHATLRFLDLDSRGSSKKQTRTAPASPEHLPSVSLFFHHFLWLKIHLEPSNSILRWGKNHHKHQCVLPFSPLQLPLFGSKFFLYHGIWSIQLSSSSKLQTHCKEVSPQWTTLTPKVSFTKDWYYCIYTNNYIYNYVQIYTYIYIHITYTVHRIIITPLCLRVKSIEIPYVSLFLPYGHSPRSSVPCICCCSRCCSWRKCGRRDRRPQRPWNALAPGRKSAGKHGKHRYDG